MTSLTAQSPAKMPWRVGNTRLLNLALLSLNGDCWVWERLSFLSRLGALALMGFIAAYFTATHTWLPSLSFRVRRSVFK